MPFTALNAVNGELSLLQTKSIKFVCPTDVFSQETARKLLKLSAYLTTTLYTMKIAVTLSNTSNEIVRIEIPSANIDQYLMAAELQTVQLEINQIYNVKLTQGCNVQRTKHTY